MDNSKMTPDPTGSDFGRCSCSESAHYREALQQIEKEGPTDDAALTSLINCMEIAGRALRLEPLGESEKGAPASPVATPRATVESERRRFLDLLESYEDEDGNVDIPRVGPRGQPLDCHGRCLACGECPREPSETLPSCLCPGTTLGGAYGAPVAPQADPKLAPGPMDEAARHFEDGYRAAQRETVTTPALPDGYTLGPGWALHEGTFRSRGECDVTFCGLTAAPLYCKPTGAGIYRLCPKHAVEKGALVPTEVRVEPATSKCGCGWCAPFPPEASAEPAKGLGERVRRLWAGRNAYNEIEMGRKVDALAAEAIPLEADRDAWKAKADEAADSWVALTTETNALRAQLAEANARSVQHAELVRQNAEALDHANATAAARVAEAIAGEREACAKMAHEGGDNVDSAGACRRVAEAIRARSGEPAPAVQP